MFAAKKVQSSRFFNLSSLFMVAAVLTGCGESEADLARKPDLAQKIATQSLENCARSENDGWRDYAHRLLPLLMDAKSSSLDVFAYNNITICLDRRLPKQDKHWYESAVWAVYYDAASGRTVTLWDNGLSREDVGWFEQHAGTYGAKGIDQFADAWREASGFGHDMVGELGSCGKGCTTIKWKDIPDYARQDRWHSVPHIERAPVRGLTTLEAL